MKHLPITFSILFSLLLAAGCNDQMDGGPPMRKMGPVEVGVVTLKSETVPRSIVLPGRVSALATAEIRPQVDGLVRKILFKEGGQVKEGDPLFALDAAAFKAARNVTEAAVRKAEATLAGAKSTLERSKQLAKTNNVSKQTLEEKKTAVLEAEADLASAKAELEKDEIDLANATIKAPISGRISPASVSVGSLVTANQTDALATIRQIDPIYVNLVDSSANLLRIRAAVEAGVLDRNGNGPPNVRLTLENGDPYPITGRLNLTEIAVSQTTGTFVLRATFDNPDHVLLPGIFVRADVDLGVTPDAFLVPQRAVTRDPAGNATAYVVTDEGKAEARALKTISSQDNYWVVSEGVAEGEKLIVDGFQKFSAGGDVVPVEVTIGPSGVIGQTLDSTDEALKE